MSTGHALAQLAGDFAQLSLMAIGGAASVLPDMQRRVVSVHGWMSNAQFASLYALAQAAPGPNMLVVSLVGWKVAGIAGALVATAAMCAPACVLTFWADRFWRRRRGAHWQACMQVGLAPITVALLLASGCVLARTVDVNVAAAAITAASALLLVTTRIHPLWLIGAAALAGAAGWV